LASRKSAMKKPGGVRDMRPHLLGLGPIFTTDFVRVESPRLDGQSFQDSILPWDDRVQSLAQVIGVKQLADSNPADSANLVLIARPDSPAGSPDRRFRAFLAQSFFFEVIGENYVCVIADNEI